MDKKWGSRTAGIVWSTTTSLWRNVLGKALHSGCLPHWYQVWMDAWLQETRDLVRWLIRGDKQAASLRVAKGSWESAKIQKACRGLRWRWWWFNWFTGDKPAPVQGYWTIKPVFIFVFKSCPWCRSFTAIVVENNLSSSSICYAEQCWNH